MLKVKEQREIVALKNNHGSGVRVPSVAYGTLIIYTQGLFYCKKKNALDVWFIKAYGNEAKKETGFVIINCKIRRWF
ncbi:hypothetical protein SDC9_193846 [bioreactor metagenome]|uniref:Uncharacterized protein n=1 Tax=bioreactor metagenome TaxID=1076179 RepID=A0A645I4P0_9ZZZZ